ncbi:MAG: hypothetical protein R8K50_00225 [Mariprofundus sp.]
MELKCILRKPDLPMLGSVDGHFVAGRTLTDLQASLTETPVSKDGQYKMVDCTGEVWDLYGDGMILSPLSFDRRKTKLAVIKLFNERVNTHVGEGRLYSERSLGSKRLDRVFADLVELASMPVKPESSAV